MTTNPTLTLCAIARNEGPVIADMLKSVSGIADELIILDTGSTDDTVTIAKQHGARVEHFEWSDDFAAARNAALDLVRSDWVLILDADERLANDSGPQLRKLITRTNRAFYLRRRHYTDNPSVPYYCKLPEQDPFRAYGATGYYLTNDLRLFPNNSAIRFEGIVHESAERSIRENARCRVEQSEATIHHIGPLSPHGAYARKASWYLTLAKKGLAQTPRDWRAWYQVGAELQGNGQIQEAIACFREAATLEPKVPLSWRQLGICLAASGSYTDALQALQEANRLEPACPLTWNALGIAFMESGFLNEAEICFKTTQGLDPGSELPRRNLALLASRRSST